MTEEEDNERITALKAELERKEERIAELQEETAELERDILEERVDNAFDREFDREGATLSDMRGDTLTLAEQSGDVGVGRRELLAHVTDSYTHASAAEDARTVLDTLLSAGELYEVDGIVKKT